MCSDLGDQSTNVRGRVVAAELVAVAVECLALENDGEGAGGLGLIDAGVDAAVLEDEKLGVDDIVHVTSEAQAVVVQLRGFRELTRGRPVDRAHLGQVGRGLVAFAVMVT